MPGGVYDSVPYLNQLEYVHKSVILIQAAAAYSAYDFPLAHRVLDATIYPVSYDEA